MYINNNLHDNIYIYKQIINQTDNFLVKTLPFLKNA